MVYFTTNLFIFGLKIRTKLFYMDPGLFFLLLFLCMDWRWRAFLFDQLGSFMKRMIG